MNWTQRIQQLLLQLEERANQCPGLYPVQSSSDFKRLVDDHLHREKSSPDARLIAEWLEELWRSPEVCYQLNAQSLIGRDQSPFNRPRESTGTEE